MIGSILKMVLGSRNARVVKGFQPQVEKINALEPEFQKLSDDALRAKTAEFRGRIAKGETTDQLLPEAFAAVRESARRTLKIRHYDVQLIGGMVLHSGKISEMSTGEGKTLVATLPVYLNALEGKGVHVVTVNDYLARRDREWMGPVYEFLGLTVGVIQHDMRYADRQAAYAADITYGTNNEFGFDYLRDNMVLDLAHRVQRPLHYAIVDEVDSILIDEARTPLIISGPAEESTDKYYKAFRAGKMLKGHVIEQDQYTPEWKEKLEELKKEYDYIANEKNKNISMTEPGEIKAAKMMGVDNLHDLETVDERHQVITALRAKEFFKLDVDYVVKDQEIIIVDEFTGRLMPGRRFSDGLHQALEAKEGVEIRRENQTLATVTFQNYFRMYKKLSGMTGTAMTEAAEFDKIYKLDVITIPTNRDCVRKDENDSIYRTKKEKFDAVIERITEEHKNGRPVLVGTISIETSEYLSTLLKKRNLVHTVLNAKYHEKEAEIIARAGQPAAITIATNMAGRGTDIVLGEGMKEKGGLAVLGTERHESRRIDNQLRGRCARQGDPGASKFYVSLEDELMRLFGSERISMMMQRLGMEEGDEIQHPMVNKTLETAQKRVEGHHFEIRKHLLEYDDVMNRQRELVYSERDRVLRAEKLKEHFFEMADNVIEDLVSDFMHPDKAEHERDPQGLAQGLQDKFAGNFDAIIEEYGHETDLLLENIEKRVREMFEEREKQFGAERMQMLVQYLMLQVIDAKWKEHLYNLDHLKDGIGLRAYGQRDPLVEYKREAFDLFEDMTSSIKYDVAAFVFRVQGFDNAQTARAEAPRKVEYLHPEADALPAAPAARPESGEPGQAPAFMQKDSAAQPVKRHVDKIGRNDVCPCGSGKKYKKCCGKEE